MTKKMFLKSLFFVLFIGIVFGVTSIASEESQSDTAELNTVEDLINDCQKENDCQQIIQAMVKAERTLAPYDLNGIELIGVELENADFSNANLSDADFRIAFLENANFNDANLSDANFHSAYLEKAELQNAELSNANLGNTYMLGANLESANLEGANLEGADLGGVNLTDTNLSSANFSNARFGSTDLRDANLNSANFSNADFSASLTINRTNLGSVSDLTGANFRYANLYGNDLLNVALSNISDLTGANLSDVAISNDIVAKPESHRSEIKLIKSACNWEEAVYTLKPNTGFLLDSIDRTANQQYVEQLKQDTASDPENPVDCSKWQDAK